MKNSKLIIGLTILLAIIVVAVGFATINAVNITISGSGSATASQSNFKVKFTGTPTLDSLTRGTASITGDLTGTLEVKNLSSKGDSVSATYTIINNSTDLKATLSATSTNSNTTWFKVTTTLADETIAAGKTTTLTVKVELIKTPAEDLTTTIGVTVTASPEAEDTTSGGGTSSTTQTWAMSADRTQVSNGTISLDIGSAVSGYTANGVSDWYVLGAENGKLLITTNTNVALTDTSASPETDSSMTGQIYVNSSNQVYMQGQYGYVNGVAKLNSLANSFKDTTYAEDARSINVDDINRVTGFDPTTFTTGNEFVDKGVFPAYGSQQTYTEGAFYVNGEWKTASETDSVTVTSNIYVYEQTAATPSESAYNLLFKVGTENAAYWLGSFCVDASTDDADFGLRALGDGCVASGSLYNLGGSTLGGYAGFRPVVVLKSNIQVTSAGVISVE